MRIVLATQAALENPTAISVLGGLARAYSALGHETVAAGLMVDEDYPGKERLPPPLPRSLGRATYPPRRLTPAFRRLRRLLSRGSFVHFHLLGGWTSTAASIWAACESRRVPFGVTFQDFGNAANFLPERDGGLPFFLLGRMLRRARWVSGVSRSVAADVERHFPRVRVEAVPNGYDPDEIGATPDDGGRPYVLCVANGGHYKGLDVLLMAWAQLRERRPGVDLIVCGPHLPGPYEGLARRLGLSREVSLRGYTPRAEVLRLMRSCLFFVLPSRHEGFGIAALEAMAHGRAVVAGRVGGLAEFIEDERTGLLCPPADPRALARALERLLGDAGLRRRLGGEARRAVSGLRWSDAASRYLTLG